MVSVHPHAADLVSNLVSVVVAKNRMSSEIHWVDDRHDEAALGA